MFSIVGRISLHITFLASLMLTSLQVQAQSSGKDDCPEMPDVSMNPTTDEWINIRSQLGSYLGQCLHSSSFFALYGAALLHTSKISQAIEMLERALLLEPDNGAALLDYSTALYYSGELIAALEINERLLMREDTPGYVRAMLEQRQQQWEQEKIHWRGRFAVLGGYHDNLNGVADLESLTLTLDGEELLVFLNENSTPIAGNYVSSRFSTQRVHLLDEGYSRFSVAYQNRTTDLSRVDTDELVVGYESQKQKPGGSRVWNLDSSYLFYGDKELYVSLGGRWVNYWGDNGCSSFFESQVRGLYFPEQRYLNESLLALGGGVRCGVASNQLTVSILPSHNWALDERPGGDRLGGEFNVKWQILWGEGIFFTQMAYSYYADTEGYSPILENNAERITESVNFSLQYIYPVSESVSLLAGYYHREQESNIELFETRTVNADVGFSISF